jgi:RNA polymerase sigma-70 factor (ECF subfamily)
MADDRPPAPSGLGAIDWELVFRQHRGWLRTVVLARVGEPQAVDDVMQEVSLAAVRAREALPDPAKLAPWLYQLAVRQSLVYRRKQGRRRKLNDRYAEGLAPADEARHTVNALAWVLAEERRELVRRAVGQLPRRDAEVLLLKYIHGWNYAQMTEHMGISHHAVANRLRRARQRLRTELARLDITEVER